MQSEVNKKLIIEDDIEDNEDDEDNVNDNEID